MIRDAAKRFTDGESWSGLVRLFTASGIKPVLARAWSGVTVRQILLSPAIAGIAIYNGVLRRDDKADAKPGERQGEESQASGPTYAWVDPEGQALRNADGSYIMGTWAAILTVDKWQQVVAEHQRRKQAGRYQFGGSGTRKYLLSGLLRCGRTRESDGQMCFRSLTGYLRKHKSGNADAHYRCPPKANGGCAGTDRSAALLEELVEDLLFAHLEANAPAEPIEPEPEVVSDPDAAKLAEVRRRIAWKPSWSARRRRRTGGALITRRSARSGKTPRRVRLGGRESSPGSPFSSRNGEPFNGQYFCEESTIACQ
ncbi:recombinase family protein [Nonomuraea sp. NPDC046802]|uniref:recombinase family protein n=1 Tax=Nonomuraea sp. NPDC046802 TaxID=3154919 RepID=UPI0033FF441F